MPKNARRKKFGPSLRPHHVSFVKICLMRSLLDGFKRLLWNARWQFVQAVVALSHTSSFWDVADVVHCSARLLPGRTCPRVEIRETRVRRESAAMRCWSAFADANGWPHFPTPHLVAAWADVFWSGATFSQYINSVRFGCRVCGDGTSWSDSFVAAAARGLRRADAVTAARTACAASDVEKFAENAAAMALGYLRQ